MLFFKLNLFPGLQKDIHFLLVVDFEVRFIQPILSGKLALYI